MKSDAMAQLKVDISVMTSLYYISSKLCLFYTHKRAQAFIWVYTVCMTAIKKQQL